LRQRSLSSALAADAPLNWNILIPANRAWVENRVQATEHARQHGATVVALSYPDIQTTRMSFVSDPFALAVPGWAPIIELPRHDKLAALHDPATRDLLRREAERECRVRLADLTVDRTYSARHTALRGRSVRDIATERGQDMIDVLLDVVVADELRTLLMPPPRAVDDEAWEARIATWRDPRVIIGASDGGAHVNTLSTYDYTVRFLARQRELGVLDLAETVRKLTDVPARLYGVADRGRLAPGSCGDIVVFDEHTIGPGEVEWRDDLPAGAGRLYSSAVERGNRWGTRPRVVVAATSARGSRSRSASFGGSGRRCSRPPGLRSQSFPPRSRPPRAPRLRPVRRRGRAVVGSPMRPATG
jgi:N-acyl-D-aspartate/D-glutamate deacylase